MYNYIKNNVESINCEVSDKPSTVFKNQYNSDSTSSYMRDTESVKNRKQLSKKLKVSKPTKTIKMTISEDGQGKILTTEGSLRNSKESISLRGSIHSKNTPQNESDSVKF